MLKEEAFRLYKDVNAYENIKSGLSSLWDYKEIDKRNRKMLKTAIKFIVE